MPVAVIQSGKPPWGYMIDPSNPKVAIPKPKAFEAYVAVNKYIKSYSYKVISDWLKSINLPLSDDGIMQILQERPLWEECFLPLEERLKLVDANYAP